MANEDSTAPETKSSRIEQCRYSNIMINLWERTSHKLTKKELEWFSGATEHAEHMIISLHDTVQGIGCLVSGERLCKYFFLASRYFSIVIFIPYTPSSTPFMKIHPRQ